MTTEALVAYWTGIVEKQLCPGSAFAAARAKKAELNIDFKMRLVTPSGQYALRDWEVPLIAFVAGQGLELTIERGVNLNTAATLDEADIVILFALSPDIEIFSVDFTKEPSRASRTIICVPEGDDGKYYCRLARENYGVATVTLPVAALEIAAECRFGIDLMRCCADAFMKKIATTARKLRIENTVVLLVHGIRTRALWQGPVKQALENEGLVAITTNYNKFDIFRFILPFERPKRGSVRRIEADVNSIRKKFQDRPISILAHSFGTYITSKLLASGNHTFDRIVFCGSVVRSDFDFESAAGRFRAIVNEIGCRDIWPAIAAKASALYGPTGSFGFNRGNFVEDRKHAKHGHSHFLNREFCERFWIPYFCDGLCDDPGDVTARPSFYVQLFDGTWLTVLFWLLRACIIAIIALPIWLTIEYVIQLIFR